MDEIDRANERTEQFLAHSIAVATKAETLPAANGHCLNCAEPINHNERWCDPDCRNDWQLRQQTRGKQ